MARGYKQREMNTHMQENEAHREEKKKLVEEFGAAVKASTPREIIKKQVEIIAGHIEDQKADRQKIYELGLKVAELEAKCINLEGTLTEVRKATKEEVPQFGPA